MGGGCLETCAAQCAESREAAALELQRQLCAGECVGQRGSCEQACLDRKRGSLARNARKECRFVFCGGTRAEPRVLGETCLVGDQHCDYEPDQRKHGTKCAKGLECAPRTPGDPVGRCLTPGADVDTAPLLDPEAPETALAPVSRWAGVFLGAPHGCDPGSVPRRVCMQTPRGMVSAERADHLGIDAPICLYVCRPRPLGGRRHRG